MVSVQKRRLVLINENNIFAATKLQTKKSCKVMAQDTMIYILTQILIFLVTMSTNMITMLKKLRLTKMKLYRFAIFDLTKQNNVFTPQKEI